MPNPPGEHIDPRRLKPHPSRALIPPLSASAKAILKADIAERGVVVPVEINRHDELLDGHNRWEVAVELGVATIPFRRVVLASRADEIRHMVRGQLARREMSKSQRVSCLTDPAVVRAVLDPILRAAQARQAEEPVPQGRRARQTRDILGETLGVSGKYIEQGKVCWSRSPDAMAAIRDGRSRQSVSQLYKELTGMDEDADPTARSLRAMFHGIQVLSQALGMDRERLIALVDAALGGEATPDSFVTAAREVENRRVKISDSQGDAGSCDGSRPRG